MFVFFLLVPEVEELEWSAQSWGINLTAHLWDKLELQIVPQTFSPSTSAQPH